MESAGNSDTWQMIAYPALATQPVSLASGPGFVIFSAGPEQQLASWLFVRWFMEPQRLAGWVGTTGYFPSRASALDALDSSLLPAPWSAARAILAAADPLPAIDSWSQVRWVLGDSARVLYAPLTKMEDIPNIVTETDLLAEEVDGFFR
jgi:multiple sugar transport system substrate-binding protein